MASVREFLVVDDHLDNRYLLTKTLSRKFPGAVLVECQEMASAVAAAMRSTITAAIVHRTSDADALALIHALRAANAKLPILYVSGGSGAAVALRTGANAFLPYDEWLRVGVAVEEMLRAMGLETSVS
jgi:CheY-like chemotaxis protein